MHPLESPPETEMESLARYVVRLEEAIARRDAALTAIVEGLDVVTGGVRLDRAKVVAIARAALAGEGG